MFGQCSRAHGVTLGIGAVQAQELDFDDTDGSLSADDTLQFYGSMNM